MSTNAGDWQGQTGENWAAEWRRTDRSFAPLTEHLLLRTRGEQFRHALDIGCGAGELALALARGRPQAEVAGVDISPALIAIAQERGANLHNVAFHVADAGRWQPLAAPDFLVSRHGVMFFDDPAGTFAHLSAMAAPGARLLFSCFRSPAENPYFTEVERAIPQPPTPVREGPGPFAFADAGKVERMLAASGWAAIECEPFDFAMIAGAGEDPVADAVDYFTRIGAAASALRQMDVEERGRCLERIAALAQRNRFENIVSLRAATWIISARKA